MSWKLVEPWAYEMGKCAQDRADDWKQMASRAFAAGERSFQERAATVIKKEWHRGSHGVIAEIRGMETGK